MFVAMLCLQVCRSEHPYHPLNCQRLPDSDAAVPFCARLHE
jgi:hypothetical protein